MKSRKRQEIEIDELISWLGRQFRSFEDIRGLNKSISLADCLLSGFAMFSLKDPSMLFFNNMRTQREENLETVYKIEKVPSDSGMRTTLEVVKPSDFHRIYKGLVEILRGAGIWRSYEYYQGHIIVALDGVHYFSSECINCEQCLIYEKRNGVEEYRHYMLSGAVVHPEKKEVMAVIHEPIVRQDGTQKNDCERNAGKRLLPRLRKQFSEEKIIIVEDGLASNGPHIKAIEAESFKYVLGVKPDGNKYLFGLMERLETKGKVHYYEEEKGSVIHRFRYANELPLNSDNRAMKVNFLEYWELDAKDKKTRRHFSWVTNLKLTKKNVYRIMRIGRSRWKIENETFNTLKNQGYHFEHNYGHGAKNLSTVLVLLMMLAFWVDQIQQAINETFKAAWKKKQTKVALWEAVRSKFEELPLQSMHMVYLLILGQLKVKVIFFEDSG